MSDWRALGQADGAAGQPDSRLAARVEACTAVRLAPDMAAYQAGRAAGFQTYCTPVSGFKEGRAGHPYQGVCPAPSAAPFQSAYAIGRQMWDASEDLRQKEQRLPDLENRLRKAQEEVATPCAAGDTECAARKQFAEETRDDLLAQVAGAKRDLADARRRDPAVQAQAAAQIRKLIPGYQP